MLSSLLLRTQAAAAATSSSRPVMRMLLSRGAAIASTTNTATTTCKVKLAAPFSSKAGGGSGKKATATPTPKKAAAAADPTPPKPVKPAASSSSGGGGAASVAAQKLAALSKELPHMDVVRYTHKNRTWTFQHVDYYSEALAIGLMENGFQPGDAVLSYLPSHFSEQMVLQFACSKAGLILYSLDPMLATTDLDAAQKALTAALSLSKANILISQEAGSDFDYISFVHRVIPELRVYNITCGMPFVTPRFPHLRLCLHTGLDQDDMKYGWLPLRQMVVPSDNLKDYVTKSIAPQTPLAGSFQLDSKGMPTALGATLTNEHVLQQESLWPTFSAILKKQYHTVQGVGVIF